MYLVFEPKPGNVPLQPEVVTAKSNDATLLTAVNALRTAALSAKTTALAQLATACAQAFREEHYTGTGARLDGTIRDLVATITRLEGQVTYYDQVITGLS